jgi:DNA-directed RNA polymerase subunit RPC12/RpoP
MSRDKDRYYRKEKYEAAISTFAVATVFTFVGILALVFNAINIDFIGIRFWGYFMFIPAFFIYIGAFEQLYTNYKYKKAVKAAVNARGSGKYKLEDIALEVGIKPKDLLRVLIDLRENGDIVYRFDSDTGNIQLGESVEYKQATQYNEGGNEQLQQISSQEKNYCVYCGHKLEGKVSYCPNCGSKL